MKTKKVKPGYQTTEFWLSLLGGIAPLLIPAVPPHYQALIPALSAAVYAYTRGQVKSATPETVS